jgi:hypothetical protein
MSTNLSKQIPWYLRRTVNQHGLPAIAGLALLACCALFYLIVVAKVHKEIREFQSIFAQPHRVLAFNQTQQPDLQLVAFYNHFPRVKDFPDSLAKLRDAASGQGVTLEQGDYHLVRNRSDNLVRYEVALPVKGDYLLVRKFLSHLLIDAPEFALNSVDFQKQKISDTVVEAQVKITLFLVTD